MENYKGLARIGASEIVEKKSRFIGACADCADEESARAFLASVKANHPNANHNCYAYRVGLSAETVRFSDDGEPSGTAGTPILNYITASKQDLRNVCFVVTRYFGGTLLGTGGLTRCYGAAAKAAAEDAGIIEKRLHRRILANVAYGLDGKVKYMLTQAGIIVEDIGYGVDVGFMVVPLNTEADALVAKIMDLTNATAKITNLETLYL